jgi:hypothetical protein
LQVFERRDRALGWPVQPDATLRRACATIAGWRERRELPSGVRTFAMHPDAAHHVVWFCPGERFLLDSRFALFAPVAEDFERVCAALDSSLGRNRATDADELARAVAWRPELAAATTRSPASPRRRATWTSPSGTAPPTCA